MVKGLIKYLQIQVATGKLTKEQVIEKYPEMEKYLEE